jgi:hypothetical protein
MFLQTVIEQLNVKFKTKETPSLDQKREDYLTVLPFKI